MLKATLEGKSLATNMEYVAFNEESDFDGICLAPSHTTEICCTDDPPTQQLPAQHAMSSWKRRA